MFSRLLSPSLYNAVHKPHVWRLWNDSETLHPLRPSLMQGCFGDPHCCWDMRIPVPSDRLLGIFGLVGWCVPPAAESKAPASARRACCLLLWLSEGYRHCQKRQKCPDLGRMCTVWGQLCKDWNRILSFLRGVRNRESCSVAWGKHCQSFPTLQLVGVWVTWGTGKTLVRLCGCASCTPACTVSLAGVRSSIKNPPAGWDSLTVFPSSGTPHFLGGAAPFCRARRYICSTLIWDRSIWNGGIARLPTPLSWNNWEFSRSTR